MSRRSLKQDKIAKVYDREIAPLWTRRFARLLLQVVRLPEKPMVLEVGCRTGHLSLELIRKMGGQGRIIALESAGPLLDVARSKAGELSGRRIFFRTEHLTGTLSFADDVYDLTCSNVGLDEVESPLEQVLGEMVRVTKPGGQVAVTLPMRGTWEEFLDIYREVLVKRDRDEILAKLDDYHRECLPDLEDARRLLVRAGLKDVGVESQRFDLVFRSAREFFFAPIIEYGPLKGWKDISGKGQEMQDIFWYIKEAIDSYFSTTPFSVTVVAGCIHGIKPMPDELVELDPDADIQEVGIEDIEDATDLRADGVGGSMGDEDELDIRTTNPILGKRPGGAAGFFGPEGVATVSEGSIDDHDGVGDARGEGVGSVLPVDWDGGEEDMEETDDDAPTMRPRFVEDPHDEGLG